MIKKRITQNFITMIQLMKCQRICWKHDNIEIEMNNCVLHKFKHHYRLLMISNQMMTNYMYQLIIFGVRFIYSWYLIGLNLIVIVARSLFTRNCLRNMNIEETSDDKNHVKQICSFL